MQGLSALEFADSMVASYIVEMETIQARLNALFRDAHEPKDQKVADECGVSQETIHRIRHGVTLDPSSKTLRKLADHFHANFEWLANGVGPRRGAGKDESSPDARALLAAFDPLPDAFKSYLLKKAQGLRVISDEMPAIVRRSLTSPTDPERYKEWERGVDELLSEREDRQ